MYDKQLLHSFVGPREEPAARPLKRPAPPPAPRRPRRKARRLPPIDFPELPIFIADDELFTELPSSRPWFEGDFFRPFLYKTWWKAARFHRFSPCSGLFPADLPLVCGRGPARQEDPLIIRTRRSCRGARGGELENMREELAQELQVVQKATFF